MAGTPFGGAGDLHVQVGLVDPGVQGPGRRDGAVGVTGQFGGDLDRDEAVVGVGVVHRAQDAQGVVDVGGDELPVGVLDRRCPARTSVAELLVVVVALADGLLEDAGVGGDAPDAPVDPGGQLAAGDPAPPEVVEPRALALVGVQLAAASSCGPLVETGGGSDRAAGRSEHQAVEPTAGRGPGRPRGRVRCRAGPSPRRRAPRRRNGRCRRRRRHSGASPRSSPPRPRAGARRRAAPRPGRRRPARRRGRCRAWRPPGRPRRPRPGSWRPRGRRRPRCRCR